MRTPGWRCSPDPGHAEGGRPLGRPPSRLSGLLGGLLRRSLLGRGLLGRRLLRRSLLGRRLLGGRLRGRLLRGRGSLLRRRLLRRSLLGRRLLGGGLLRRRCLLRSRGGLLGRRGLLRGRSLLGRSRGLLGRGGTGGQRQLRQLLGAGHDVLQVRTGGELRHRGLLRLDPRAGLGVAHPTGLADTLLERPEARDRDLLALRHLAGDRVQDGLQRMLGLLAVPLVARRQRVDELRLVHGFPFPKYDVIGPMPDDLL